MDNMSARVVRGSKLRATLVAGLKNVPPQRMVGLTVREGKGVKLKEPKPVALSTKPSIRVDLVKSTGRVRLTIDNMIIEVGVI